MKKLFVIVFVCAFSSKMEAQILIDSSKTMRIQGYAGILCGTTFNTDSSKASLFANIRLGTNLFWNPSERFGVFGIGSFQVNQSGKMIPWYIFGLTIKPNPRISLVVGRIPSPMTEMRAMPNSGSSQFEPWTRQQILPAAYGGKAKFSLGKRSAITIGGFWRQTYSTIELGVRVPYVQIGVYGQLQGRKLSTFGAASVISTKYVIQTFAYNHKAQAGSATVILLPKGWMLYSDIGFSMPNRKFIRGEWGVLKSFKLKNIKGLFGAGYAQESRTVNGYLQINL